MMSLTGYLNAVVCTLCSVGSYFALFQVQYFKLRHRQPLVTGEGKNKNVETFCDEPLNGFFSPNTFFGPYKAFNILLWNLLYILGVQRACEDLVPVFFPVSPNPHHVQVCVCTSSGKVEVNISAYHHHQVWRAENHGVSDVFPPWWSRQWAVLLIAFVYGIHSQLTLNDH